MWEARIKVDAGGNSYVAASDYNSNSGFLFKFDANGVLVKMQTVPGGVAGYWESDDIAYDPLFGRIYTAISFYNADTGSGCVMVMAYDSNLELIASQIINDAPFDNWFARLAVDSQGNVYVNGMISGDVNYAWSQGFFEVKYSPGLSSLIFKRDPIMLDVRDKWLRATSVDLQGNTYSVGEIEQGHNDFPAFLMKRNAAGDLVYLRTFQDTDVSDGGWNTFYDVAVDKQGNPYVVDLDYGAPLIKYDPDGNILWSMNPPSALAHLEMSGIDLDSQGNVYTAGQWLDPDYNYDIAAMKYSAVAVTVPHFISKSAGENQIVTTGGMTQPLVGLVNDDKGNAAGNIGLTFMISTFPAGAAGQELTKSSETTSAQGLADVQLKLGNIPAEYGVTATCASCEPSASSVTFTCCGKLPNDDFKQFDVVWSTHSYDDRCHLIGSAAPFNCNPQSPPPNSIPFTIRQRGCAMSVMADVLNYYHDRYALTYATTTPLALNQYLRDNAGFDNGDVDFRRIWNYTSSLRTVCYTGKAELSNTTTLNILRNRIDANLAQGNPVILRVPSAINPSHFVVAIGKCAGDYLISDPGHNRATISPSQIHGIRTFSLVMGSVCPTP
jgi:hypothetical protein